MAKINEQTKTERRHEQVKDGLKVTAAVESFPDSSAIYTTMDGDFFGVHLFENVPREGLLILQSLIKEILKDHPA